MSILQEWAFILIHRLILERLHQAAQAAEVQAPAVRGFPVSIRFAFYA